MTPEEIRELSELRLQSEQRLLAENSKLRTALKTIADYYGKYFQEGEVAYQAAIIARDALEDAKPLV